MGGTLCRGDRGRREEKINKDFLPTAPSGGHRSLIAVHPTPTPPHPTQPLYDNVYHPVSEDTGVVTADYCSQPVGGRNKHKKVVADLTDVTCQVT